MKDNPVWWWYPPIVPDPIRKQDSYPLKQFEINQLRILGLIG